MLQDVAELLTTPQAAALATRWRQLLTAGTARVTPATIRSWRHRGHLTPRGLDAHGRPLYHRTDLARAEQATRPHALRAAGLPDTRTA